MMVHKVRKVQNEINSILFAPCLGCDQKKLLTIVVALEKEKKFDFLKAETEWIGEGSWKKFRHERDAVIEVEFKDKGDKKTKRLMPKLEQYNRLAVKEQKLYARVLPVSASTINK
jgi:hypothetical protein